MARRRNLLEEALIVAEKERKELEAALRAFDNVIEHVLAIEVSGGDVRSALHELDEVRGNIWASYTAASRALKEQKR